METPREARWFVLSESCTGQDAIDVVVTVCSAVMKRILSTTLQDFPKRQSDVQDNPVAPSSQKFHVGKTESLNADGHPHDAQCTPVIR
jgi:hypothetical protein